MPVPLELPARVPLLRDHVFVTLRDLIVNGTLAPGEQIHDGDLAQWLGVSRTPVREALLRLQQSGLVASKPGRATFVTTIDARSTLHAQSVVAAMHRLAVEEALDQLTADDIADMRRANLRFTEALNAGDVDAALDADDELHRIPVVAAANGAVAAVLDQFTPLLRRVERLRFASLSGRASVALHDRLITLCEARDIEAANVSWDTWQTLRPLLHLETDHPSEETDHPSEEKAN